MNRGQLLESLAEPGGWVAEVGVHVGDFAEELLLRLEPSELFLIDSWRFLPGEYERDPMNKRTRDWERTYRRVVGRFRSVPAVRILRELSLQAVERFEDGAFECVYLDADHTLEAVQADLEAWWPKVRSGGVLAGHDYGVDRAWIDVKEAVDPWAEELGLELHVSDDPLPSWAVVKP